MREIKFRAWDDEQKIMFDSSCPGISIHLDGEQNSWNEFYELIGTRKTKQLVLLQYIGIKDKNGKEIYEGDIIKYLDGYDTSSESGFDFTEFENRGIVEWDDEELRYTVSDRETIELESVWESEHIEVIGNVYEDCHLLKEDENHA